MTDNEEQPRTMREIAPGVWASVPVDQVPAERLVKAEEPAGPVATISAAEIHAGPLTFIRGDDPGDARCNYCDGPMPCHCEPPRQVWAGDSGEGWATALLPVVTSPEEARQLADHLRADRDRVATPSTRPPDPAGATFDAPDLEELFADMPMPPAGLRDWLRYNAAPARPRTPGQPGSRSITPAYTAPAQRVRDPSAGGHPAPDRGHPHLQHQVERPALRRG